MDKMLKQDAEASKVVREAIMHAGQSPNVSPQDLASLTELDLSETNIKILPDWISECLVNVRSLSLK